MRLRARSLVVLLFFGAPSVRADDPPTTDKSGVSPNSVSRPKGPGSLEGLGESFQPALNTGTARYSIALDLPPGVAGFKPGVSLKYDNGFGQSPLGIGWAIDVGSIRRQAEKGLPRYPEVTGAGALPDRFIGMEDEELVPLVNGYHLAKIEGTYLRYRQLGDHWEAHTKSGTKLEFGITPLGRIVDATGLKIARWCLERQTDTNGNVIEYTYVKPVAAERQNYLERIRWGPGAPPLTNSYSVNFLYEPRTDVFTDYRAGFRVQTSQRLSSIEIKFNNDLIRRYELEYEAHPHWSFLSRVTQYGYSGGSLPATTFTYDVLTLCQANSLISATGSILSSSNQPAQVMDNQTVDLIDLNADALPDILVTGSDHFAYLNRGVVSGIIQWEGPVDVGAADPRVLDFDLTQPGIHLSDMTGDGIADLVAADEFDVEYFANTGETGSGPGATGWAAGTAMQSGSAPPARPFSPSSENVKTADLDFDKTIDVVQSNNLGYDVWLNLGGSFFAEPIHTDGARYFNDVIQLDTPGVSLADMNGDRLVDVVQITSASIVYCASMGYGQFDTHVEIPLPDRFIDVSPGGNLTRASMQDVNGDGLSDLVVERATNDDLWVWINLGDNSFATSCTITNLPATAGAVVRWADINGNGTTDLIYADSTLPTSKVNAVDVGVLLAGTPHTNLLRSIANGFGRVTTITYESSTTFAVEAANANNPWTTSLPFPSAVVAKTETSLGLDFDGYPGTDTLLTDFSYRDGYYDPVEKQFRGFGFAKQMDRGDERFGGTQSPPLVTRFSFHTGAPDGFDNDNDGQTDEVDFFAGREEEPLKGSELWRETTTLPDDPSWDGQHAPNSQVFQRITSSLDPLKGDSAWVVRNLCTPTGGFMANRLATVSGVGTGYRTSDLYGRQVRQAVRKRVDTYLIERDNGAPKQTTTYFNIDEFGNEILEWKLGDVDNVCVGSGTCDDLYESTTYVFDANAESRWMLDRVQSSVQRMGGPAGAFVAESRNYYDGPEFVGLGLGQLGTKGQLHRVESVISDDTAPPLTARSYVRGDPRNSTGLVDTLRQEFDAYGNPITLMDANGNVRRLEYDSVIHAFPTKEIIQLGGANPDLTVEATYDLRFGKPVTLTDFNGHVSVFDYDEFGRLTDVWQPGDPFARPSQSYAYQLGNPVSGIQTTARTNEGSSPDVISTVYFDGAGRKLGSFDDAPGMFPGAAGVMHNVIHYDARGQAWKMFNPFPGSPFAGGGAWQVPSPGTPFVETQYDATGRVIRSISQDDEHGVNAISTREYQPLKVIESDGEDNRAGSPHFGTPKTLVYDGLERLIEVHEIETLSPADSGTFVTRYRYAMPDLLAEIEDSNQNIKYMRYDALGRKIFMNDLNRGHMHYTYDAAGNLLRTKDAKNQEIVYTYDGANRLLSEDFLDSGHPLSFHTELAGRPDVVYHYDAPHPSFAHLANTKGEVGWIEDLSGAEFRGYNARGAQETTIKRIKNLTGDPTTDYVTTTLVDNLDRVFQVIYHDGGVVRYDYDSRGQLSEIPNFADAISYTHAQQMQQLDFANGVVTTRSYDPRLRLLSIFTDSPAEPIALQDMSYDYDQADNITAIADGRALPGGQEARSQTASYLMDNLYRLTSAGGATWSQQFDYDRLGNMTKKLSSDSAHPEENVGSMFNGGAAAPGIVQWGTQGRVGKNAADAPGPHALTSTSGGAGNLNFGYDNNGNMINNAGDLYTFDFKDRLGRVDLPEPDPPAIRYIYDYSGRRIIKRVDAVQTSYIDKFSEIRDGELDKYVWNGDQRLAKVEGGMPDPPIVTQRISFVEGFNSFSFQVDPGTTDPATILADLAGNYIAIYAWDATTSQWQRFPFDSGIPAPVLTSLVPNRGYWVDMAEPGRLVVEGPVSTTSVSIPAGVQAFVGIPGLAPRFLTHFMAEHLQIQHIWTQSNDESNPMGFLRNVLPPQINVLHSTTATQAIRILGTSSVTVGPGTGVIGTSEFFHGDYRRSTQCLTNHSGSFTSEIAEFPYGRQRNLLIGSGIEPNYQFLGEENDSESSLHPLNARYYCAPLGRFESTDPASIRMIDLLDTRQLHSYSYGVNNPLAYADPSGLKSEKTLVTMQRRNVAEIRQRVRAIIEKLTDEGVFDVKLGADMVLTFQPKETSELRTPEKQASLMREHFNLSNPTSYPNIYKAYQALTDMSMENFGALPPEDARLDLLSDLALTNPGLNHVEGNPSGKGAIDYSLQYLSKDAKDRFFRELDKAGLYILPEKAKGGSFDAKFQGQLNEADRVHIELRQEDIDALDALDRKK